MDIVPTDPTATTPDPLPYWPEAAPHEILPGPWQGGTDEDAEVGKP